MRGRATSAPTAGARSVWSGKLGLVAGLHPAIDQHHAVIATLGERFVMYRIDVGDPTRQAEQSLHNLPSVRTMRAELREVVGALFAAIDLDNAAGRVL